MSYPQPSSPHEPSGLPEQQQPLATHELAPTNIVQHPLTPQIIAMPQPAAAEEEGFALRNIISIEDVIRYIRRYWKLAATVAGLCSALLCLLMIGRTPQFESATHMEVQIDPNGPVLVSPTSPLENSAAHLVNNHLLKMQTEKFHTFIFSNLDENSRLDLLENRGFTKPPVAKAISIVKDGVSSVQGFVTGLFSSDEEEAGGDATEWERREFIKKYNNGLKVDLVKESHAIRISFKGPDRSLCAVLANETARLYREFLAEEERSAARAAFDFLSEQEERYRLLHQDSTHKLNKFRLENEILGDGSEGDPVLEQLKTLYAARGNERIKLTQAESILLQVESLREVGRSPLEIQAIDRDPGIQELKKEYNTRQQQYDAQFALHGESNFKTREAKGLAAASYGRLTAEVDRIVNVYRNQKNSAAKTLVALDEQRKEVEKEVLEQGEKGIELANLRAQANSDKKTYELILEKQNQARFEMDKYLSPDIETIDVATEPEEPYTPNKPLSVIMSGFVFMMMFVGLPLTLGLGNDMSRRFGFRIPFLHRGLPDELGQVPLVPSSSTVHMLADAFSPGATREALFKLAKNLEKKSRVNGTGRVILVTSAEENEGKSFVAAALGGAYCSQGRRTLIIDCNLHSPTMNVWFPNLDSEANVVNWLESNGDEMMDLEKLRHGASDLFILPAHGWSLEPEQLLRRQCMAHLIEYAKDNFDFVLIDGPQVSGRPDAEILANHAGEIVLVSDRKLSDYKQLSDACESMGAAAKKKIVGLITNRADQSPI